MQDHKAFLENIKSEITTKGLLKPDVINFYASLFDYHNRQYNCQKTTDPARKLTAGLTPLIDMESFKFQETEIDILVSGLSDLVSVMKDFHPGLRLEPLVDGVIGKKYNIGAIAKALITRDIDAVKGMAIELKIGQEELIFILVNWLKPFFINIMENNRDIAENETWFRPECPVCGSYPDMAMIAGSREGRRYLHCSLCENEWLYKRISCAVCGNEDTGSMGYFSEDGHKKYRIDYCDKCRGYIKTFVIEKFTDPSESDLTVLNIITADLDSSAAGMGYSRP
jgi:FdhE protein